MDQWMGISTDPQDIILLAMDQWTSRNCEPWLMSEMLIINSCCISDILISRLSRTYFEFAELYDI